MTATDTLRFAARAASGYPLRSALLILAMSIGAAAVVMLTALGDGARQYIVGQFASLGSNLIMVLPGRTETGGIARTFVTFTPRDLTIEDALTLTRSPYVSRAAPISAGTSEASANGRMREVTVFGTSAEFIDIRHLTLSAGRFLPADDWRQGSSVAVIGTTIQRELFGNVSAIGQNLRMGDRRLRIIGVMAPSGQGLDINTDEAVFIPVATAQSLFNTTSLFRIMVETRHRDVVDTARIELEQTMRQRHDGELDVTMVTQDAVLSTFDRILRALTLGLAGIATISLLVAGILVMNVMLVAVTQRTAEIGLLKALGASHRDIVRMFLTEATLLSLTGAVLGFVLGHAGAWLIRQHWPMLPAWPPAWAVMAALSVALCSGLAFGVMPARRAAALDPVSALTGH